MFLNKKVKDESRGPFYLVGIQSGVIFLPAPPHPHSEKTGQRSKHPAATSYGAAPGSRRGSFPGGWPKYGFSQRDRRVRVKFDFGMENGTALPTVADVLNITG